MKLAWPAGEFPFWTRNGSERTRLHTVAPYQMIFIGSAPSHARSALRVSNKSASFFPIAFHSQFDNPNF
jgi:hypothetical protein